jgi:hypothetical protein
MQVKTTVGDDLLRDNYPQIHAVGRAAPKGNEPRLIDMTWGTQGYALGLYTHSQQPTHTDPQTHRSTHRQSSSSLQP